MQKDIRSDKLNPGFSDTAAFFQARGMKARDPLDKDRLMETAEFYRSLAVIVPRFPPGYKSPAFSGNKFMDRAEECRALAESLGDTKARDQLLKLAGQYEKILRSYLRSDR